MNRQGKMLLILIIFISLFVPFQKGPVRIMKNFLILFLITILFCLSSCDEIVYEEDWEPIYSETEEIPVSGEAPVSVPEIPEQPAEAISKPEPIEQTALSLGLDRTKTGFGYSPNQENKQVSIGQKYEDMITKYGGFFIDRANTNNIYLTMDEGYENGYTPMILDTLKEKGVQCTFFVTKSYVDRNPELIKRMIDEGHIVGNHSVNHKSMPTLTDEEAKSEIMELHKEILTKYGYTMKYFRPPMGEYSESSLYTAQSAGYRSVFWSFAYRDWETDNSRGKDYAIESVNNGIHNGCVILLHAVSKDNAEGLGEIIDSLRAKGYVFASLDDIK